MEEMGVIAHVEEPTVCRHGPLSETVRENADLRGLNSSERERPQRKTYLTGGRDFSQAGREGART